MSTLNVSMPDSMREYVEAKAKNGQFSVSEYIRHLIREDQIQSLEKSKASLVELLAISAKQVEDGEISSATAKSVIDRGRAKRAAQ